MDQTQNTQPIISFLDLKPIKIDEEFKFGNCR